jgi:hypothetical protein
MPSQEIRRLYSTVDGAVDLVLDVDRPEDDPTMLREVLNHLIDAWLILRRAYDWTEE